MNGGILAPGEVHEVAEHAQRFCELGRRRVLVRSGPPFVRFFLAPLHDLIDAMLTKDGR